MRARGYIWQTGQAPGPLYGEAQAVALPFGYVDAPTYSAVNATREFYKFRCRGGLLVSVHCSDGSCRKL
jgi:hypothetical protein